MFLSQGGDKLGTRRIQSHRKCHQESFPQRPSKAERAGNFSGESQSPCQSPHVEVGTTVRTVGYPSVYGERLNGGVEFRYIHDRRFVADSGGTNILSYNGQECFAICVGRWNIHLREIRPDIGWEIFLSSISRRVHASEEPEVGVTRNRLHEALFGQRDRRNRIAK